jgi:photosystem II stability/assembly factor-like uncharacterized protein
MLMLCTVTLLAQSVTLVEQGRATSIRGLSVVNDKVAWVSGSKGHVGISLNGGQTWVWQQVKGFEQSDFRDIEAFSDKEAVVMSSGTPAVILKTTDGGANWQTCYRNDDQAYFFDAMAFTANGKHGYVMGDPIEGQFLLLETLDGGITWKPFTQQPEARLGEAAFAASGTCLQISSDGFPMMVTGGTTSRYLFYGMYGKQANSGNWNSLELALSHGKPSQGAFSFTRGAGRTVFIGGDYALPNQADSVACYTRTTPVKTPSVRMLKQPSGYQSCVIYIAPYQYLSTGTAGTHLSIKQGQEWQRIDTESYNVCQKAKQGDLILLAGDKGRIAIYKK